MLSTDTKRLEDAYRVFNREYFNGELPMVMITIQSSLKAYGHCTTKKIWASGAICAARRPLVRLPAATRRSPTATFIKVFR